MISQQSLNLDRVSATIGASIIDFCRARLAAGVPDFHADDLRRFVAQRHPTAPASADRVLRQLRLAGALDYTVVNRRASLYHLDGLSVAA